MDGMFEEAAIEQLERAARAAYHAIAEDYYTDLHPTSKAFSWTIDHYLQSFLPELKVGGFYLEVGSGRGRIQRLPGAQKARLFLLDISEPMLRRKSDSEGSQNTYKVLGSAFALPFAESTMEGVFSFLGDPFSNTAYYVEARRVAKCGAKFLHVIPHCEWGNELRRLLGIPLDTTFFVKDGQKIVAPSLLPAANAIERQLTGIGFTQISFRELRLPRDYPEHSVPEHIVLPSKFLNLSPYELPILLAVEAIAGHPPGKRSVFS